MIARSTPWGTIWLGKDFHRLTAREQDAVLAHECGHIHHRHVWKRLKWLITLRAFRNTNAFFAWCALQELEADRYAADRGHKVGLIAFLKRNPRAPGGYGYPSHAQRIEALNV